MKKRSLCLLLCLCAVLLAAVFLQPVTVSAAEETRYCQGCQQDIALTDWTAIGGEQTETVTLAGGGKSLLSVRRPDRRA